MVSFVIPCYRSAATIEAVIDEIALTMKNGRQEWEAVLVNDCSPDDTWMVIKELAEKNSRIIAINLAKNFGQHAALMAGFHHVSGDVVVCLDDDGQTPACEVLKLIEKINEGYDVVYASYDIKRQKGWRNLGSAINSKMTEWLLNKPKDLVINSYFATKRFIVDEVLRYQNSYPYVIGLILRSTKNICNVTVHHRERQEGSSGYTLTKLLALWMNGFTSFSVKPLRIAAYLGALLAFLGFCGILFLIINKITSNNVPMGWSSVIAVMLFLGGATLLVLGMIGEYVGRIYMCVNASPQFVIRETVKGREERPEVRSVQGIRIR